MKLALRELEPRDALSPADLGGGVLRVRTGWEVYAYEDWRGALNVLDTGGEVYVGPGAGGGPRVRAFDKATGAVVRDFFAGDPADRSGVVPLGVGLPAERLIDVPHLSAGDTADFAVYVDFERPPSAGFVAESFAALPPYFAGLPLAFTTDRPARNPTSYATVVVGADPSWASPFAAGEAPIGGWRGGVPAEVSDGYAPALTAAVAAHELGHLFGLQHSPDPGDVMYAVAGLGRRFSAAEESDVLHTLTGA